MSVVERKANVLLSMILKTTLYIYFQIFIFLFTFLLLVAAYILTLVNLKRRKELRMTEYKLYLTLSDSCVQADPKK